MPVGIGVVAVQRDVALGRGLGLRAAGADRQQDGQGAERQQHGRSGAPRPALRPAVAVLASSGTQGAVHDADLSFAAASAGWGVRTQPAGQRETARSARALRGGCSGRAQTRGSEMLRRQGRAAAEGLEERRQGERRRASRGRGAAAVAIEHIFGGGVIALEGRCALREADGAVALSSAPATWPLCGRLDNTIPSHGQAPGRRTARLAQRLFKTIKMSRV